MSYNVEIERKAKKFIKTLPKQDAIKILELIEKLRKEPRPRWVEKLKGLQREFYRVAWGNYRMIYTVKDEILLVTILTIDGRDDAYKNLNKKLL